MIFLADARHLPIGQRDGKVEWVEEEVLGAVVQKTLFEGR